MYLLEALLSILDNPPIGQEAIATLGSIVMTRAMGIFVFTSFPRVCNDARCFSIQLVIAGAKADVYLRKYIQATSVMKG